MAVAEPEHPFDPRDGLLAQLVAVALERVLLAAEEGLGREPAFGLGLHGNAPRAQERRVLFNARVLWRGGACRHCKQAVVERT